MSLACLSPMLVLALDLTTLRSPTRPTRLFRTTPIGKSSVMGSESMFVPGPSASLPELSEADLRLLAIGKRLQRQNLTGQFGFGWAVQELRCDPDVVWQQMSAFGDYESLIKTVRNVEPYDPEQLIEGNACYSNNC